MSERREIQAVRGKEVDGGRPGRWLGRGEELAGRRRASCQRVNISVTYRRLITVERGYRPATGRRLQWQERQAKVKTCIV